MPDKHKHPPIPFRPPEGDRGRLLALARRTGQPVNRILRDALAEYLDSMEDAFAAEVADLAATWQSTATCEDRRA